MGKDNYNLFSVSFSRFLPAMKLRQKKFGGGEWWFPDIISSRFAVIRKIHTPWGAGVAETTLFKVWRSVPRLTG